MSSESGFTWATPAAVVVLALVAWLVSLALSPPAPVGLNAPPSEFSAARAARTLTFLLGDESPHPVGSAANKAVRDRLLIALQAIGLQGSVQAAIGCATRYNGCANVENVIARIPGEKEDAILIMAHYDSVPHAPGAADDGAGVAAMLEIGRILQLSAQSSAPRRNSVILLFTDAEEVGLMGAEAFFAQHELLSTVKAVINIEGSGSGGPAMLLRTTADGSDLLAAFRRAAPSPVAVSVAQEIFTRMPNDTDFSVAERAGIPSIDFAFSFEFNHYHTPLDTISNLDKGTLQHHGENVLPMVQELLDVDLGKHSEQLSYFSVHKTFWLAWPVEFTVPLAVFVLLLLVFTSYRTWSGSAQLSLGFLSAIGVVVLGAGITFALNFAGDLIAGTTPRFPAVPWPWRILLYGGPLLAVSLVSLALAKRLSFWPLFLGVWWLLALLALSLSIMAPLAANLLLIPVLIVAVLASLFVLGNTKPTDLTLTVLALIGVAAIGYFMFFLAYANEETQGMGVLAPTIYVCVVIACVALLPLRASARFTGACAGVVCVGLVWLGIAPTYSAWRPQHISVYQVQNLDDRTAEWAARSANPLPQRVVTAFGGNLKRSKLTPWSTSDTNTFTAPYAPFETGKFQLDRSGETIDLKYTSRTGIDFLFVVVPEGVRVKGIRVAGRDLKPRLRDGIAQIAFFAPSHDTPLTAQVVFIDDREVEMFVVEGSNSLPEVALGPASARGDLAVPQHRGDQFINYRRVMM